MKTPMDLTNIPAFFDFKIAACQWVSRVARVVEDIHEREKRMHPAGRIIAASTVATRGFVLRLENEPSWQALGVSNEIYCPAEMVSARVGECETVYIGYPDNPQNRSSVSALDVRSMLDDFQLPIRQKDSGRILSALRKWGEWGPQPNLIGRPFFLAPGDIRQENYRKSRDERSDPTELQRSILMSSELMALHKQAVGTLRGEISPSEWIRFHRGIKGRIFKEYEEFPHLRGDFFGIFGCLSGFATSAIFAKKQYPKCKTTDCTNVATGRSDYCSDRCRYAFNKRVDRKNKKLRSPIEKCESSLC